jgi:hypothetical protein
MASASIWVEVKTMNCPFWVSMRFELGEQPSAAINVIINRNLKTEIYPNIKKNLG